MNYKLFIIISILGLILFNGISLLFAVTGHTPFEVNILIDVITPIAIGLICALDPTLKRRTNRS